MENVKLDGDSSVQIEETRDNEIKETDDSKTELSNQKEDDEQTEAVTKVTLPQEEKDTCEGLYQIFDGKWRLTDESKLENESKEKWKYEELIWILPEEGTEGCIEDQTSGKVLAFQENEIILEDKEDPISDKQKWNRGISDENGWFLLGKPYTSPSGDDKEKKINETEEQEKEKHGEDPVIPTEDLNKSSIKTNEEIDTNFDDENVICSCPFCCCCVCSCIKSISKIGTKARRHSRDDKGKLWHQKDEEESIDLTKSQKRDLYALKNYGLFRNTTTYRYY